MKIRTHLSKKMTGRLVAESIKNYYLGDTMDQTIGMTADGNIDYEFDAYGGEVVVPFYETRDGWTLGDGDYWTPEFWTEEILDWLAEQFAGDWHPDLYQIGEEIGEDIKIFYNEPYFELKYLQQIELDNVSACDLKMEISKHTNRETMEAYGITIRKTGDPEEQHEAQGGTLLWFPNILRGGVEFGADSTWTDADNPEDCVNRVLNGDIIE